MKYPSAWVLASRRRSAASAVGDPGPKGNDDAVVLERDTIVAVSLGPAPLRITRDGFPFTEKRGLERPFRVLFPLVAPFQ